MSDRIYRFVVSLGVLGIWILIFQNAGLIPQLRPNPVSVQGSVNVAGEVEVSNTVDVAGTVEVDTVANIVDVHCDNCQNW
jgi:hypothetical protein